MNAIRLLTIPSADLDSNKRLVSFPVCQLTIVRAKDYGMYLICRQSQTVEFAPYPSFPKTL